ncbi:MAG: hypothetical protein NC191_03835 [Muribaculaceae bacterium]|nr:hypothetical protein [Muribaculaceae bacterium]
MHYDELFDTLQNLMGFRPTAVQVAKIIGINKKTMYARQQRNSKFSEDDIAQIYAFYKINNYEKSYDFPDTLADKVEIQYYINPNLQTNIKTPKVTSIWFDRELVENIWGMNPSDLCVVTMLGDKMDHGEYPLRKNDILIMDTSDTDVVKSGIYAFTTHNDAYMFINGVNRRFDGTWRFYFYNKNYPEKILTDEEVKKADIRIIGRIVKNLSLTI